MSTSVESFAELGLSEGLLKTLGEIGYETPSPIQAQCIPVLLDGRDLIGQAQTGTGKTAAFALPLMEQIDVKVAKPQALVLTAIVIGVGVSALMLATQLLVDPGDEVVFLGAQGGHPQDHLSAQAAALVRHAPARARRGSARGAGRSAPGRCPSGGRARVRTTRRTPIRI